MPENGEPIARGRRDLHAAERRALRDAVFFAAFFGGVVLINAVLGLVLIEFFGSIEPQPAGSGVGAAATCGRFGGRSLSTGSRLDHGS